VSGGCHLAFAGRQGCRGKVQVIFKTIVAPILLQYYWYISTISLQQIMNFSQRGTFQKLEGIMAEYNVGRR